MTAQKFLRSYLWNNQIFDMTQEAKKFVEFWTFLRGSEKVEDQTFWNSEENIHKVIDPLFLDALRVELDEFKKEPNLKKRTAALIAFQEKLGKLRFLDPACGSGNFLTETYISLRKMENEALALRFKGQGQFDLEDTKFINVSINQFYGIEINDFAVTVAQTAMWIAECKMMQEANALLAKDFTPLTLTDFANILEGNALKMDWGELGHFDFIMGNPPFVGARNKTSEQSADMMSIFVDEKGKPLKTAGNIDYVAAWYWKACEYAAVAGRHALPSPDDTEVVPPNPCNPRNPWFEKIFQMAQSILDARALYPDSSLADLYDPLPMPSELRKAHQANDAAVMKAYGFPPDLDEAGIVSHLFELYAELVEKAKGVQR